MKRTKSEWISLVVYALPVLIGAFGYWLTREGSLLLLALGFGFILVIEVFGNTGIADTDMNDDDPIVFSGPPTRQGSTPDRFRGRHDNISLR